MKRKKFRPPYSTVTTSTRSNISSMASRSWHTTLPRTTPKWLPMRLSSGSSRTCSTLWRTSRQMCAPNFSLASTSTAWSTSWRVASSSHNLSLSRARSLWRCSRRIVTMYKSNSTSKVKSICMCLIEIRAAPSWLCSIRVCIRFRNDLSWRKS